MESDMNGTERSGIEGARDINGGGSVI